MIKIPTITPELAGTGLIASFGVMGVALVFQLYMLWLNWKQSKVKDTTTQLLNVEDLSHVIDIIKRENKITRGGLNGRKRKTEFL